MATKPIYSTNGEWMALLDERRGYLYDTQGDWIGWLEGKNKNVYNRDGVFVGFLSDDGRILRERVRRRRPLRPIPSVPRKIRPPAKVPLAPLFAELPWKLIDVFEEEPKVFEHVSERRPDWED